MFQSRVEQISDIFRRHPGLSPRITAQDIEEMRTWIKRPYDTDNWRWKVDRMPPAQVIAIFRQMSQAGRFTTPQENITKSPKAKPHWQQMTIWDYIPAGA